MLKKKLIAVTLSLTLALSGTASLPAAAKEQQDSHLSIIRKEIKSRNNGLTRYHFVDEDGKSVDFSEDSVHTKHRKRASALPTSYDARSGQTITGIKDQGYTGSCWAFGAIKSLESSSIKKGLTNLENTDFSESHLTWYTYHGVTDPSNPLYGDSSRMDALMGGAYDQGGAFFDAASTLASWCGAAREADAPFSANSPQEVDDMERRMASADESLRTKDIVHLSNFTSYEYTDIETKKQAIMDNGAMIVSLYFDNDAIYTQDGVCSAYQDRYTPDDANHVVTIVGWDDDFSSFPSTPSGGNGAWLIANSYGTDWGNDGYYWVSYYDTSLCEFGTYEAEAADNYDTNYQYDGTGYGIAMYDDEDDLKFSNVFTNTSQEAQKISAAAFYTLSDGQKYEISVYHNLKSKNPVDGSLAGGCTTNGIAEYNGYHTVPLSESITVAPGESFSIVATFFHENNRVYLPLEGESAGNDYQRFGSRSGQSFIYENGTWKDATNYSEDGYTYNLNNVCLKAFGTSTSEGNNDNPNDNPNGDTNNNPPENNTQIPATKITVKNNKFTMGTREKVTLSCAVSTANTTDTLKYTSSNPSVASVNSQGVVTGAKTGTAKITVTSTSGKAAASVAVTVKKAPSSVKAKAGKSVLKKGKTTKVKVTLSKNSASYKITYKSSNKKIATVSSSGLVKAKKKGTVKITVTTYNGKKKTIKIKVK